MIYEVDWMIAGDEVSPGCRAAKAFPVRVDGEVSEAGGVYVKGVWDRRLRRVDLGDYMIAERHSLYESVRAAHRRMG